MSALRERIAGAPISWGVCEIPGWGVQLPAQQVLDEMASIGLRATERGPDGFLPEEPAAARATLETHGLSLVGGFVPVVLHRADRLEPELGAVRQAAEVLSRSGASVMTLAAATGRPDYETRPVLDDDGWTTLAGGLDRASEVAAEAGVHASLHPHVGTVVERPDEIERVAERSSIPLCLDTGHVLAGGGDPAALTADMPERIAHVHMKDADAGLARQVREGRIGYRDAVDKGMYRRLGDGDVDVAAVVQRLERAGYEGWYVLEQDLVLTEAPEPGGGPVRDVQACLRFLEALDDASEEGVTGERSSTAVP